MLGGKVFGRIVCAAFCCVFLQFLMVAGVRASDISDWNPDAEVDVELVLAVDISLSMDSEEQEIQREGYAAAIVSDEVLRAIGMGPTGRIALTYMEWAGELEQFVLVDWAVIKDAHSAGVFAEKLRSAPMRSRQRTSISSALHKSADRINSNDYIGLRKVVDISGDGPNNQGGPLEEARDRLIREGIVINGLPLKMKRTPFSHLDLEEYYVECVIGGTGAFQIPVLSTSEFQNAIKAKLVMEIAGIRMQQPVFRRVSDEIGARRWCDWPFAPLNKER